MNTPIALLGFGLLELGLVFLILGGLAFWLWMIVDCITHETDAGNKIAWLLVILLVGIIGAPLYFFARKLSRPGTLPPSGQRPLLS